MAQDEVLVQQESMKAGPERAAPWAGAGAGGLSVVHAVDKTGLTDTEGGSH